MPDFAVVDVETTGLFVNAHDRVVEIGIVSVDARGELQEEWGTLVNPGRDLGPTEIHGIRGRDVENAPTFADVIGDVCERLHGRMLVAHNVRFDSEFITAEFKRAGYEFPESPWLCTMELGGQETGARRLSECCDALAIRHEHTHSAIDDARAAALVLGCLMGRSTVQLRLSQLLGDTPIPSAAEWPHVAPCSRLAARGQAQTAQPNADYLAVLLDRLVPSIATNTAGAKTAYLELLDRALEDRRLSATEAESLHGLATAWGLTAETIRTLHDAYLQNLVAAALQDGTVTQSERTDLEDVSGLLSVAPRDLERLMATGGEAAGGPEQNTLAGLSVCFSGQLTCTIKHLTITREAAQLYATEAGLTVLPAVTKKLEVLVVADADSLSGKARKARTYGTRIMVERAFWNAIGVQVD